MQPFADTETGYTATAKTLVPSPGVDTVDFSVWGNPERQKINQAAPAVNIFNNQRWGVW